MNPDMLENITLADAYDIVLEDLRKAENKISLLKQRLSTAEAELEACQKLCAIYYEIAAAAIGEEQTIALRDAAMRRKR